MVTVTDTMHKYHHTINISLKHFYYSTIQCIPVLTSSKQFPAYTKPLSRGIAPACNLVYLGPWCTSNIFGKAPFPFGNLGLCPPLISLSSLGSLLFLFTKPVWFSSAHVGPPCVLWYNSVFVICPPWKLACFTPLYTLMCCVHFRATMSNTEKREGGTAESQPSQE